jgi:small neutral amino acid transporter SnatA (MarC family)
MTLTLLVLAYLAAANPFRVAAATTEPPANKVLAVFAATFVAAVLLATLIASPILDLVEVTGSSARIAAGIAVLAVALKDAIARPPSAEPGLTGAAHGAIPLAFPIMFSPAVALLAIAASENCGIGVALVGLIPALVVAVLLLRVAPLARARLYTSTVGLAGVGVAGLVALDGVYAI